MARSNVCPAIEPPPEPSFHAFCYTETAPGTEASFVVAGSAEAPEGHGNYRDHIVRLGDMTHERHSRKGALRARRDGAPHGGARFHAGTDTTATQIYTVHDIHPFLADEIVRRGAARSGVTWHYNRPPVVDLEYEMDCRGVSVERIV